MVRTKIKKHPKRFKIPVIGKYIDTPTNASIKVTWFVDAAGDFKLSMGNFPSVILKGVRFGFKNSEAKRKKKFYRKLQPFLAFSTGWRDLEDKEEFKAPLLFGLLKIRKGKQRKFVLIQSVDRWADNNLINVVAVVIDNLLYLDLVNRLKNAP